MGSRARVGQRPDDRMRDRYDELRASGRPSWRSASASTGAAATVAPAFRSTVTRTPESGLLQVEAGEDALLVISGQHGDVCACETPLPCASSLAAELPAGLNSHERKGTLRRDRYETAPVASGPIGSVSTL